MLILSILRHAKSSWDDEGLADFERPLATRGREAAPRMGRHLRDIGLQPDLVLCSSAVRARETARLVGLSSPIAYERELYAASASELLERLHRIPRGTRSVLLIGHNPGLHELALQLIGGMPPPEHARLADKLPTTALLVLALDGTDWGRIRPAGARVVHYVTPRDLTD
ncbi:MAG: histidine phosphatase family protein [Hyphomicrobiaceae bacterium]|nr:histidine phosphatase family protein [Hyphomicrobiaceae bacterium]